MKKFYILALCIIFFVSCNASILMNNGEIEKTEKVENNEEKESSFSKKGPEHISATKAYYKDRIVIRWSSVEGADFYTLERASSDRIDVDQTLLVWKEMDETVEGTYFVDGENLEKDEFYFYRVQAHTYEGKHSDVSQVALGSILSSPSVISASKGKSSTNIEIEWEQVPFVETYKIYKSLLPNVSGLESEYVATIDASLDTKELVYSYEIDSEKEKGKELYFAIVAIGATNEMADISLPRSGYTLVPGAPGTPEVVGITKGDDKDAITISFRKDSDDGVNWIIKRYSLGSSETIVYSGEYGDKLEDPDENGVLHFVDKNVKSGVEYTYSLTAYNSLGPSAAVTQVGYLLSPVSNISLLPLVKENGDRGYLLTFKESIGSGDEEREEKFKYTITRYNKEGVQVDSSVYNEGSISSLFFPVAKTVTPESEKNELYYVTITVSLGELSLDASSSERIPMMKAPVKSISATKNEKRKDGEVPNSNGVYPVTVTWASDVDEERTIKRVGSDGSEKEFVVSSGFSLLDTSTLPLVTYDYYIDTSDVFGRSLGEIKHTGPSYASIDETLLLRIMESVSLKPFDNQKYVPDGYKAYWKNSKIATLVSYGNASDLSTQMKALDKADDKDHFRGGTITYNAKMEGAGGAIYFTYSSFGENENLWLDGSYEMHVNASGTGSASSSTDGLDLKGMYEAHISLEKISVSKKAFVGSYVVKVTYSDGEESYEVGV